MNSVRIPYKELEQFVKDIFMAAGVDEEQSSIVSRHLILANLRGVDSHGVNRVNVYTKRLDNGIVINRPNYCIEKETDISALIDGGNNLGIVLASKGIELAVEKAKKTGVGITAINNSNHCGMMADYTGYAAENDCIAIAMTNAPSNMAPWGGKERFFGTNPISYSIPAGQQPNIILDMATSLVARGKIILAQKNKQKIPLGWAMSKDGKQTSEPGEALDGIVLPAGGYKGYGITFLVESLSALFTGAAFGPHVGDLYKNFSDPQNVGQFFLVIRADLFQSLNTFKQRIDQMIDEIRSIPLLEGVDKIYLPGEIEHEIKSEREVKGIPVSKDMLNELSVVAERYGVKNRLAQNLFKGG